MSNGLHEFKKTKTKKPSNIAKKLIRSDEVFFFFLNPKRFDSIEMEAYIFFAFNYHVTWHDMKRNKTNKNHQVSESHLHVELE